MEASFSLQDCDRKTPPQTFPVVFVDDKASGTALRIKKGQDERTKRPIIYVISLTPGAGKGTWSNPEEAGDIEYVQRHRQSACTQVEGIWIEGGQRLIAVLELPLPEVSV